MSVLHEIGTAAVVVRPREHVVEVLGNELDLTSREYEIVLRLAEHPRWVFSAEQLSGDGEDSEYSPESVSVLVSRLRHKFALAGAPDVLETVRGVGYRLHAPSRLSDDAAECCDAPSVALHEAMWNLQEAVVQAEHSDSEQTHQAAADALEAARSTILARLEEEGSDT